MIENNNEKINDIINGDTNITISYDSDVIRPGDGISLNTKTPNRVKVENSNQNYNVSNTSIVNIFNNNTIELSKFSNYIRHEEDPLNPNPGNTIVLTNDHDIFINDSIVSWKKGQTLKLVFSDEFTLGLYNVFIKTDALNKLGLGTYAKTITVFDSNDFTPSNDKPIFEIICINAETLEFKVDKIR
jgi:hypothetical protein